jgi:hypothetical protein
VAKKRTLTRSVVWHFARSHAISQEQAERLLKRFGSDPEKLQAAVERLKLRDGTLRRTRTGSK